MLEAARQLIDYADSEEDWSDFELKFGRKWTHRPSEERSVMVGDRACRTWRQPGHSRRGPLCPADLGLSGVIDQILELIEIQQ